MDNEFYERFNTIEYSENDINEYIKASKLTDEDAERISGSVRLKYGQKQVKYNAQKLSELLEDGESVQRIIKFKDIESLWTVTACSSMGMTAFKSNDFGVFKMICFTNKRMLFTDTNVLNEALTIGWINNDDIIGTKFTTKRVIFDEKDPYNIRFSRWTRSVILADVVLALSIFGVTFRDWDPMGVVIAFILFLIIKFQQKYLDRYVVIMKDKRVFSLLISTYSYDEDREFLVNSTKNLND